jgi:hypothetical protein
MSTAFSEPTPEAGILELIVTDNGRPILQVKMGRCCVTDWSTETLSHLVDCALDAISEESEDG